MGKMWNKYVEYENASLCRQTCKFLQLPSSALTSGVQTRVAVLNACAEIKDNYNTAERVQLNIQATYINYNTLTPFHLHRELWLITGEKFYMKTYISCQYS